MILIGAGGHSKVILDIADLLNIKFKSVFDNKFEQRELFNEISVISKINNSKSEKAIIGIGNNRVRYRFDKEYNNLEWATLIHPKAIISKDVVIVDGSVIMAGCIIQPGVRIGKHCIINTGACIDHDVEIGDFVHVAPNCSLAGGIKVLEGSFIGIGASVIPEVRIGSWSTIGAGSVVLSDVENETIVMGIPAKVKYGK